ncbi:MAG: replicative DNA helicase [Balneolaceae bacterium]
MPDRSDSSYNKSNGKNDSELPDVAGRVPPQAIEVEEAVLGAMLIEHEAATIALQMLRPDDFYKPAHRHIFETISELYERDNPLDLLTVENELRDKKLLDSVGGGGYLSDLTRAVSSSANIDFHAQIIAEKAIKRNLILNCTEIIKNAYDTTTEALEVLDAAEQRIFDLSNTKTRANAQPIGDILKDTLQYLEEIRGKPSGITGVPTGLDVDKLTSGFQPGDLVIIAARPSMGKTAFMLSAARNAALHVDEQLQTNVAIFSLEMSNQSLVQRLLTMEARIDAQTARSGRLKDEEFKRLIDAASRLFTARLFIDDTPGLSIMELRTKCRRLKSEHDIGMIIVDYLQLMTAQTRDNSNREQEIATISRGLKALAKDLKVPVIALSQLSRAVEQRGGDKRPQLSDLRESGCLTGDTLIPVHSEGKRIPIRDLLGKKNFEVWALNQQSKKLEISPVSSVFSTGIKSVYELETRTGRTVRATGNHKFLTIQGWKRLDQLTEADLIATPRKLTSTQVNDGDRDQLALLGQLIGGSPISEWLDSLGIWGLRSYEKRVPEWVFSQSESNVAHFLKHLWTTDGCIRMRGGQKPYPIIYYATSSLGLTKDVQSLLLRLGIVARVVASKELAALSNSDIYWDQIISINRAGEEEVYDITVPVHHNFVANDIVVHNSIEQDADVVMFLYRPEYYGITTTPEGHSTKGLAEIIVGKQRNGPTGAKRLFFVENYARFENFTQSGSPYGESHSDSGSDELPGSPEGGAPLPPIPGGPGPDDDDDDSAPF